MIAGVPGFKDWRAFISPLPFFFVLLWCLALLARAFAMNLRWSWLVETVGIAPTARGEPVTRTISHLPEGHHTTGWSRLAFRLATHQQRSRILAAGQCV